MANTTNHSSLPPLSPIPADIVSLSDYARLAPQHMPQAVWSWLDGGAADELTLQDNITAFAGIRLNQRVLQNLEGGNTALTLFGQHFNYPIMLAPIAQHSLLHADAELATLLGASAMGAGMLVSTQASIPLEVLAKHAAAPLWFQLYMQPDRTFTEALVRRAEAAGYSALVVTIDAPVSGVRNREQRCGFDLRSHSNTPNLQGMPLLPPHTARPGESPLFASALLRAAPVWSDIDWLRTITNLPILLKGILHPADATQALNCGMDGLIVSNHGGRVLDTVPASIHALPAVAAVVNGAVPILLDGGVRRGTDIIKALALGASAVLIGRPYLQALAVGGPAGVAHALHILRTELEMAMIACGCKTLAEIDHRIIWQAAQV